jgi:glucosamine--fructose-6-phosphate aminotransferase (isomerizing)
VKKALRRVVGSYALVVLSVDHPEFIIAARKDSPLIIGIAQNETFIASDIPAILNHTRDCIILQDDEIARIGQNGAEVFKLQEPNEVSKEIIRIEWDPVTAEKGGYAHFMEKEIYEQPKVLAVACQMAFRQLRRQEAIKGLSFSKPFPGDLMKSVAQIYMVACGTAYHAALLGREYFHRFVGLPVQTEMASEFRYHDYSLTPNTLCVFVSQSGETADTLAALREAKKSGAICLAVVNVVGSSIAREADFVLYTNAGPEIAVASTKAYVSQLVCLLILAHHLGEIVNNKKADLGWPDVLNNLSVLAGEVLEKSQDFISGLSTIWAQAEDAYFIGRGLDYPLAMEGQLKLKEISYVHAESLPAGELKHGTLALITSGTPVIALATQPHLYSKMLSNIREVGARGADIFGITIEGNDGLLEVCHRVFFLPQCDPLIAPVLAAIPLQLLAYEMAKVRGCDIDKPRNLAKSVTVE